MNINILSKGRSTSNRNKRIVGNMSQNHLTSGISFTFTMRVCSRDIETKDAIRDYFSNIRKTLEEIGFDIHAKKQ